MSTQPAKALRCPVCNQTVLAASHKPFCSERCQNVDLHRWLTDGYIVAADDSPPGDEITEMQE